MSRWRLHLSFSTEVGTPPLASADGSPPPDGTVSTADQLKLLADWGPCPGCGADFDCNLVVSTTDYLQLITNWGPCPWDGGDYNEELEEALELMGFDDVEEYLEWLEQATDAEALASGYILAALMEDED